jgi:hypothetical protein
MERSLLNSAKTLLFALFIGPATVTTAQPWFTITPQSSTLCTVGSTLNSSSQHYLHCTLTGTVPGAGYYTYTMSPGCSVFFITQSNNSHTVGIWANSPGTHTVYGLAYASNTSSVLLAWVTQTIFASPGPSVTVSGPMNVCPNTTYTYNAFGASSYTFFGQSGSQVGSPAALTTGASSGAFTVVAQASNGCTNSTPFYPIIGASITVAPSNTVCSGATVTLSATGGLSYTWNPGNVTAF